MERHDLDIAIAGGGLAGGLIALALHFRCPDLKIALFESGETIGGHHRWSWFDSDLSPAGRALMSAFDTVSWPAYNVRFPKYERTLGSRYNSLASADFDRAIRQELPAAAIRTGTEVVSVDEGGITLADQQRITASAVVDCRGAEIGSGLEGGWQVFLGRHLRCEDPHGVTRPIIMDADVAQHGAYRFVYVLPLSDTDLFIEDTYYADEPLLERAVLAERIDAYCEARGWRGETLDEETGVLPVISGGDASALAASSPTSKDTLGGVALGGIRGGFTHPLTSYTLPFAVENAIAITRSAGVPGAHMAEMMAERSADHWRRTGFYRLLGRMLFGAALPEQRYIVFQHFYRLPQALIERFYAGRSTALDKARILSGRPPVPVKRALHALVTPGTPLSGSHEPKRTAA